MVGTPSRVVTPAVVVAAVALATRLSKLPPVALAIVADTFTAVPAYTSSPTAAFTVPVELPTGDTQRQLGSGVADFTLNGVLQKTLTERTTWRVNGGVIFSGNTRTGAEGVGTRGPVYTGGTSLVYFSGIQWGLSERLFAMILPVKGDAFYVSPAFESLGYPLDDWLKNPDMWLRVIHPEDSKRIVEKTEAAMRAHIERSYQRMVPFARD